MDIIALKELELQIETLGSRYQELISLNKALREQVVQLTLERNRLQIQKESAKQQIRSLIDLIKAEESVDG